ncbi:MAG: DUF1573 domain-containing protein [Flavisolibacter sp.]
MKKLFILAAAIVTGLTSLAQQSASSLIKPDVSKYDFGKLKQNVPAVIYFTVTNTSDKPVVIENATAGCGCTTPEYKKTPIAPGGSTKVKVGYNAAAMGRFEKDVSLKLAGVQEPLVIKITGEVVDAPTYDTYTKTPAFKKSQKAKLAKLAKDEKEFNGKS